MSGRERGAFGSTSVRATIWVIVTTAALLLAVSLVLAAGPNFDASYKTGPPFADAGEVFTYTIVVVNDGDPVEDVVLSDTLPGGVTLVGCTITTDPGGTTSLPCSPGELWTRDMAGGERITTTLAVEVNVGTLQLPLVNQAHIGWPSGSLDLPPVTTVVNPAHVMMPIVLHGHRPSR